MSSEYDDLFKKEIYAWWTNIQHDSGGLSRLKHQSDILGIQAIECFYDLVRALPGEDVDCLSAIAMVISHIEENSPKTVAELMGSKKHGSEEKTVSELRFNKLISMDLWSASRELIRMLPLIEKNANIKELSLDLKNWDKENQFTKKRWLNQYYIGKRR